jgi:hypothetical protein
MADIEYRITIDQNGQATVVQDIRDLTTPDNMKFTSNKPDTAIKFTNGSPFTDNGGPKSGEVFKVGLGTKAYTVQNGLAQAPARNVPGFGQRKTYHFECGKVDTAGAFVLWGGSGGDPTGGHG